MAFHRQWRKLNVQDAYSNVVPLVALDAASTERHLTTFGFSSDVKELKTLPPSETDLPWGAAFAGIDKVFPQRWLHADEKQAAELDALVRPHLLFRPSDRTQLEQCQGRELHKRSTSYNHALLLDIVGAWFESNLKLLLVPRTSHVPTCPMPQLLWFAYFVGCKEESVPPLDLGMARVQSRLVDLHAARRQPCPCQQPSNECEPAQPKLFPEQFGAAGEPLLGVATSCKVARRLRLMSPAQVFKGLRQEMEGSLRRGSCPTAWLEEWRQRQRAQASPHP